MTSLSDRVETALAFQFLFGAVLGIPLQIAHPIRRTLACVSGFPAAKRATEPCKAHRDFMSTCGGSCSLCQSSEYGSRWIAFAAREPAPCSAEWIGWARGRVYGNIRAQFFPPAASAFHHHGRPRLIVWKHLRQLCIILPVNAECLHRIQGF